MIFFFFLFREYRFTPLKYFPATYKQLLKLYTVFSLFRTNLISKSIYWVICTNSINFTFSIIFERPSGDTQIMYDLPWAGDIRYLSKFSPVIASPFISVHYSEKLCMPFQQRRQGWLAVSVTEGKQCSRKLDNRIKNTRTTGSPSKLPLLVKNQTSDKYKYKVLSTIQYF